MGLDATVHLIGYLPDVRSAFHAADFFCLPTYYDPCSLVVFEALACGLPVITTAYNGAGELMTQGREGFVVPSADDHEALADAMDRLTDDEARRVMSGNATALGRAQSFDRHVERLVAVFEDVVETKRGVAKEGTSCRPLSWPAAKGPGSGRSRTSSPSL